MADDLEAIATEAAERHGLPKKWFLSLIGKGEGGFRNPEAVSPKGAMGPGQLMPDTAKAEGVDPTDLADNIEGAARYAGSLYAKYHGNTRLAAAAYNAGPGAVDKHGGVPPYKETEAYVDRVGLPTVDDILDAKPLPTVDEILDGKPGSDPGKPKPAPKPDAKPPGSPLRSAAANAVDPIRNLPGDIGHEFMEGARGNQAAFERFKATHQPGQRPSLGQVFDPRPGLEFAGNTLRQVTAPITGAAEALAGRPVEAITGSRMAGEFVKDALTFAVPVAEELGLMRGAGRIAQEGGVSALTARRAAERARMAPPARNALKATAGSTEHAQAVDRLRARGVEPAAHQASGGLTRRIAETQKSNPYLGEGIRGAELDANRSFQRGVYNDVLSGLGERLGKDAPVGNDGVKAVKARLSAAYDAALPHIRLSGDQQLTSDLAGIRTRIATAGEKEAAQYEAILNQDVLHHFAAGGMDGEAFKSVESDITGRAAGLKASGDPNQRQLGRALEATLDALRADMVRSSDPAWAPRLKAINAAYAKFARLRTAASNRVKAMGEFTPSDLLAAVRREDKSRGKGDFATGDALLQDFARDAQKVLGDTVNDSGTAERLLTTHLLSGRGLAGAGLGALAGGPAGALIGGAADLAISGGTNALARRALARHAMEKASRTGNPRNFLKAAQMRALPTAAAPAPALPPPDQTR